MDHERKPEASRRGGDDHAAGVGRGNSVGKRSLADGEGLGDETPAPRAIPRLDLFAKPGGTGDGDAPAAPAAKDKPAATGKGSGKGTTKPKVTHKTQDKAPGGAPATRTTVGVGELVIFKANSEGTWTASAIGPGLQNTASGDEFFWTAMDTKGSATITFDSGQSGAAPVSVTMTVLEPTVDYLHKRKRAFKGEAKGVMGAGMDTDVTFLPLSVSFANTMWWEEPGDGSGATGYFKTQDLPHHDPAPDDLQIDKHNSGIVDNASFHHFEGPFRKKGEFDGGSFEWAIPTYYRVLDGDRHLITTVHQRCTVTGGGTTTVSKGSSSISRPL